MVLPVADRIAALKGIRESGKTVGKTKLYYKGQTDDFDVFQIDLDWLVFNRHNGRIESEMLTWQFEHDLGPRDYSPEIHKRIADFLWKANVDRNKHTLADLETKQQQRPGIVSLDGVIIDGNRRAMLLAKIKPKPLFQAVILPDDYYADEKAIVRLETEFQIGEDSKLDYGALEKYLKVKRLRAWYDVDEIAKMMATSEGDVNKLIAIMELMDDYLAHIDCDGLYNMLKEGESNSTKEGMFVDLHLDLKRIEGGNAPIPRVVTKVDKLALKIVQFDYIRMGAGVLDGKDYREISHNARGEQSFFAKEEIWKPFRKRHEEAVQSVEAELGSLDGYIASNPHFTSRSEAAQARDNTWRAKVAGPMKGNFNRAHGELEAEVDKDEPRKLLERALAQLARVNIRGAAFIQDRGNENLVKELNRLTYEMKKRFDRAPARN